MIEIELEDGTVLEVPVGFWDMPRAEQEAEVAKAKERAGIVEQPSLVETQPVVEDDDHIENILDRAAEWAEKFKKVVDENLDEIVDKGGLDVGGSLTGDPKEAALPYVISVAMIAGVEGLRKLELPPEAIEVFMEVAEVMKKYIDTGTEWFLTAMEVLSDELLIVPIGMVYWAMKYGAALGVAKTERLKIENEWVGVPQEKPPVNEDVARIQDKKYRLDTKQRNADKVGRMVYLLLKRLGVALPVASLIGNTIVGRFIGLVVALLTAVFYRAGIFGAVKAAWDNRGTVIDWLKPEPNRMPGPLGTLVNPLIDLYEPGLPEPEGLTDFVGANRGALIKPRQMHWSKGGKTLICK